MRTDYKTERAALTQLRAYIQNGFPEYHKTRLQALKRSLELRLDKAEYRLRSN